MAPMERTSLSWSAPALEVNTFSQADNLVRHHMLALGTMDRYRDANMTPPPKVPRTKPKYGPKLREARFEDYDQIAGLESRFGLSAKRPLAVIAWPVVLVIALPWFIGYALFGGSSVAAFLLVVKNVVFIRWAAEKLRYEFRAVAPLAVGNWFKQPEELLQT